MADEFTLIPTEEEPEDLIVPEEIVPPKKRVSNPVKQGVAGVTDIFTGIPAVIGLAGSGIQAGFNTLTGDKGFGDNFAEAMREGLDKDFLDAGLGARKFVNETLGIKDPVSTEDQAARLIGTFLPIPGFAVAANAGRLAKVLKHTSNIALPIVRTNKGGKAGFARRGAAQLGIGVGAEQGIRALQDKREIPLMFSDAALAGEIPEFTLEETGAKALPVSENILAGNNDGADELRELDRRMEKEQDADDVKFWLILAGTAIVGAAGAKYVHKNIVNKHGSIKNYGQYLHEQNVDKAQAFANTLRKQGYSEDTVQSVVHNAHSDFLDVAWNFLQTGKLGQDFIPRAGTQAHSLTKMTGQYKALGQNKQLLMMLCWLKRNGLLDIIILESFGLVGELTLN